MVGALVVGTVGFVGFVVGISGQHSGTQTIWHKRICGF